MVLWIPHFQNPPESIFKLAIHRAQSISAIKQDQNTLGVSLMLCLLYVCVCNLFLFEVASADSWIDLIEMMEFEVDLVCMFRL